MIFLERTYKAGGIDGEQLMNLELAKFIAGRGRYIEVQYCDEEDPCYWTYKDDAEAIDVYNHIKDEIKKQGVVLK